MGGGAVVVLVCFCILINNLIKMSNLISDWAALFGYQLNIYKESDIERVIFSRQHTLFDQSIIIK